VSDHTPWAFLASAPARSQIAHQSLGPLATLARDVTVTDIFVLGDGRVFADRGSGAVLVSDLRVAKEEIRDLARALIEEGGRHLDEASPLVDIRLEGGVRVHAALPPVAVGGPTVSRPGTQAIVCVTLTREHPTLAGLGPAVELESTRCGLDGSPRE
jgi:pilus assembly protein CpaF